MQSPTALLKNKMNQAAFKAKQFVSGAAGSVAGAVNAFTNPPPFAPVAPVNRFASSRGATGNNNNGSSGIVGDGGYPTFTRAQLNALYGNNSGNRGFSFMNTNFFNLGEGPIEHMIMMFQLYIALIAALGRLSMNAASMSTSFLFGNETLINIFSIFLENALNLILNRNVADMSLDQLHQSLVENKPKLKEMSAILINELTTLALGLSDVCSKIATSWVTDVLPGLLKSSAIGASSAAEAGINAATMGAFGEVVEIFSAGAATLGGMMKIMKGLQSNVGNFSEAYGKVSNAYDGMVKLKELFSKSPSEIAAAATAAVIPKAVQVIADRAVDVFAGPGISPRVPNLSPLPAPAAASAAASSATPSPFPQTSGDFEERLKKLERLTGATATAPTLDDPLSNLNLGNLGRGIANAGIQGVRNGVRTIGSKLMGAATTFSDFLKTPEGKPVADANGEPIKTSLWNRISKSLFDRAMSKIRSSGKYGKANETIVQYILRNPDILIPFLPVPYNIAAIAFRLVQTYLRHVRKPNDANPAANPAANTAANTAATMGGGGIRNKNKSIKYKNRKHFKRYMSNLRRKTAKKELQLLNGIRDFKSMIRL
jgi:hypothetical protein